MNYLQKNARYWAGTYNAPNVESFIFRMYGRILVHDYGIDGSRGEKVFDFGMGQGGALHFFHRHGFNVFGVDIAQQDIEVARQVMPERANQFRVISPTPNSELVFYPDLVVPPVDGFDVVISIQTLDFLSNSDFEKAVAAIYKNMKVGAKIYASMNGWDMYYRNNGTPIGDGLWHIKFDNGRVNYDLALNFVRDKDDMRHRFRLFKPVYLDHYDSSFREEGSEYRYTFFGVKE
jgi:hypothetical protein